MSVSTAIREMIPSPKNAGSLSRQKSRLQQVGAFQLRSCLEDVISPILRHIRGMLISERGAKRGVISVRGGMLYSA